jgi:hypothetical protein
MAKTIRRVPEIGDKIPRDIVVHSPHEHASPSVAGNAPHKLGASVQRGQRDNNVARGSGGGRGAEYLALSNNSTRLQEALEREGLVAPRTILDGGSSGVIDGEYRILVEDPPVRSRPINHHEGRGRPSMPSPRHGPSRSNNGLGRSIRWGFYIILYEFAHLGYWVTLFATGGEFRNRELAKYPANLILLYGIAALLCFAIVFAYNGMKLSAWLEERKRIQEEQNARQFDTSGLANSDRMGYIIGGASESRKGDSAMFRASRTSLRS